MYPLVAAIALSLACATLGVFVVSRRWAFIGEGIGHGGFGGAGTAWLLALLFPSLDRPWLPFTCVVVFCLLTAAAIGALTRDDSPDGGQNSDSVIGIFMVASLAWGFLAREIFRAVRHQPPAGFDDLLFGQMSTMSNSFAAATTMLSAAVILAVAAAAKEIIYYSFDPAMARASGVRAGWIHHLLLLLVTLTIVLGIRVAGGVLITALLVLPGATGLLVGRDLREVFIVSLTSAAAAAAAGMLLHARWRFVPVGPAVVLTLFAAYVFCVVAGSLGRARVKSGTVDNA